MATGQAAQQAAQQNRKTEPHKDDDRGPGSVAGNLTQDPELRFTGGGRAVANIRVASTERVQNKRSGDWEDGATLFYDITCWAQLAEHVCEYLQRGDRIVAEGRWTSNTWVDKDDVIQEKIVLTARDLGPSLMFRGARVERPANAGQSRRQRQNERARDDAGQDSGGGR